MLRTSWRCSNCGSSAIAEGTDNCRVLTKIIGINQYGQIIFGDTIIEVVGVPNSYVCLGCRKDVIYRGDVLTNRQELADMLKETNLPINE